MGKKVNTCTSKNKKKGRKREFCMHSEKSDVFFVRDIAIYKIV